MSGELRVGCVDAADDLRRPTGQQPAGLGQLHSPADSLEQPRPGLGFESGEVWLTDGCEEPNSRAAAVTDPCRATASSTRRRVTSSTHQS